jgi:cell division protein FtsQ
MKRPPGVPQAPRSSGAREPERANTGADGSATPTSVPAKAKTVPAQKAPANRAPAGRPPATQAPVGKTARKASAPSRSEPDATTEPITVPTVGTTDTGPMTTGTLSTHAPSTGSASSGSASSGSASTGSASTGSASTDPASPGLLARLAARRTGSTGARRGGSIGTADVPLTARAARSRLRAARRARKQYERSEVRRFTSRSRRRRNIWLAAAGTVVALVAFVLVGVYSPLMALKNIEVTGTERIPAADIVQALDAQLDTPLPLIDFAEVKQELSEFSLIRSYVTESRPPNTLVVRIVEREPIGSIASAAGFDLVDAAGVVITSGEARAEGYPVVDAAGGASGAGFQAAVAVIGALPEGIRTQLDTVTAATKDDVTLTLAGGARVVWGNSERAEYKAVVLSALLVSHPVGSVTEYDVSSPDSAVVR